MKKLEEKVIKFIDEKNLIEKDDKILVALSGGPDSVFLLHFLNKYKKKYKISLGAIHINHLLRGNDADNDEKFSKNLAKKYKIKFISIKEDVKEFAKKNKISFEEAGREIRYKHFNNVCETSGYTKIATGHNSTDNAETIFLNLIKGTGIKGLAGIPEKRDKIIRPLLNISKDEILHYLIYYNIEYRTDQSNESADYERNFIRNKIFPLIRKRLNNSIDSTLSNTSVIFKNYNVLIDRIIAEELKSVQVRNNILIIPYKKIFNKNPELYNDLIKAAVERNFHDQITFNDLYRINNLLGKTPGTSVHLSNKLKAVKERDEIVLLRDEVNKNFKEKKIFPEESVDIDDKKISIKKIDKKKLKFTDDRSKEYISADDIAGPFEIRRWRKGDWFFPLGLKESKKISDFLAEQKVPSHSKNNQLILTCNERIVWVIGLRIDNRFRITPETKKVLELCLK